mgnify:CR=1 FL=1
MALVKVDNLSRVFDVSKPWLNRVLERREKEYLTAVSEVSFDVAERSTYALVGESGSGKSTLLRVLRLILIIRFPRAISKCLASFWTPWCCVQLRHLLFCLPVAPAANRWKGSV